MTITGAVIIPLGLLSILLPWRYGLIACMVAAMMTPAAVANVGAFGLQPGYFMALLVIGRTAVEISLGRQPLNRCALIKLGPIAVFLWFCILALLAAMVLFEGRVYVIGGTDAFSLTQARPYHFRRENITQLVYLLINIVLVYCLAHQCARLNVSDLVETLDRAIICALGFAAATCAWQLLAFRADLPFPEDFFYSNAGYFRADSQVILDDVARINGCFDEPSALGYAFTGFLLFAWARSRIRPGTASVALIATSLACMIVSTSTTAYFGIAVFTVLGAWDFAKRGWTRLYKDPRLSKGQFAALGAAGVMVVVAGVWASHNWELVDSVFTASVLEKGDTSSFEERHGVDQMALEIIGKTGGMGIGLGSHKPNSLLMTIVSNAGLGGLASFALFLIGILGPWRASATGARGSVELTAAMAPFRWFVIGLLIIHSFSNPNLSSVLLWLGFGAVIGLRASTQGRVHVRRDFGRGARIEAPI